MTRIPFEGWPKIPRVSKGMQCVVTEKIDGTNAQIHISRTLETDYQDPDVVAIEEGDIPLSMRIGSRSRWITPESDNYNFARSVLEKAETYFKLGEGAHFGEWYGLGIQHGHGMKEKRLALFNNFRWDNVSRPEGIDVVPTLYKGDFHPDLVNDIANSLKASGSILVPGWMKPEGFIIYFPEFRKSLKWTYEAQEGKWKEDK